MNAPITTALRLVRLAVCDALDSLTTNGCHWLFAGAAPLPLLTVQPQDGGGQQTYEVGAVGWTGLLVVRALATEYDAAETIIAGVPAALSSITQPVGYDISLIFDRPLSIPPSGGVWTAAQQYQCTIERTEQ